MCTFEKKKGIENINKWDEEHIFYNPIILSKTGKVLKETDYLRRKGIYKLGQLLEETSKESRGLPFDRIMANFVKNIRLDLDVQKEDMIFFANRKKVKMSMVTQKDLYEDAVFKNSKDHSYQTKWVEKLNTFIFWEEVWNAVHSFLLSNETKTIIWEQIHLNFYTQYSYNKWHNNQGRCPLCRQIPNNIYHIMLHCDFVNAIWTNMQPILSLLHNVPITDSEKALGLVTIKSNTGIWLRNWLTYKLREQIMLYERKAYHSPTVASFDLFKARYNQSMAQEIKNLLFRFKSENKLPVFDKIVAYGGIICEKVKDGEYRFKILLN